LGFFGVQTYHLATVFVNTNEKRRKGEKRFDRANKCERANTFKIGSVLSYNIGVNGMIS
jgi:hypothetical protein